MWWAWQIATASASAASGDPVPRSMAEAGRITRTITCTCSLPAWPAPTTDFLHEIGGIFEDFELVQGRVSRTTPRASPSFKVEVRVLVDESLLDRRGVRLMFVQDETEAGMDLHQALGQGTAGDGRNPACRDEESRDPS